MRTDGSLSQALDDVIQSWRRTRHPRLGDLAEVLSAQAVAEAPRSAIAPSKKRADLEAWVERERARDPLDLPSLMAGSGGGKQEDVVAHVQALAAWDDPRLGRGLIALLEKPPYAGVKSRGMLQAILDALEGTRDPRLPSLLRELAGRYLEIVHSGTGGWMIDQLNALAARLEALAPPPALSPDDEAAVAALEARLGRDAFEPLRAVERKARAKASLAALHAAVYAAPGDDGPRLVLADALLELGDPRGELIVLQVARARGEPQSDEQRAREAELLHDKKRLASWAQPLSNAGDCTFERGFPERVALFSKPSRPALEDPAWATVRALSGLRLPQSLTVDFLSSKQLAGLRDPGTVGAPILNMLAMRRARWPWTHLEVTTAAELAPETLAAFPLVEELTLYLGEAAIPAELLRPLARLAKLALRDVRAVPVGLVDGLSSLTEMSIDMKGEEAPAPLTLPPTLASLRLHAQKALPRGALDHGAHLRRLALRLGDADGLEAALAHLPALEHLELWLAGEVPSSLFRALGHLVGLELWLRGTRQIPRALLQPLSSLTTLSVSYAELEPGALAHLERLQTFSGARVPVGELPRAPLVSVDAGAAGPASPRALEELLARTPTLERLHLHLDRDSPLAALVGAVAASPSVRACVFEQHGKVTVERGADGRLSQLLLDGYGTDVPLAIGRALPTVTAVRCQAPYQESARRQVARELGVS